MRSNFSGIAFFALCGFCVLSCSPFGSGTFSAAKTFDQSEWYAVLAGQLVSGMTLAERSSQVLMVSIDGKESYPRYLDGHFRNAIPGAIILFGYNIADTPSAVRNYLASCQSGFTRLGARFPALFAIDDEGGSVFRTARVTTRLPSAASVRARHSVEAAERLYFEHGRALASLGIAMNLAPVAEPGFAGGDDFLKDRAYGDSADVASAYALAAMKGYGRAGIIPVAKHFPGSSFEDPHEAATVLDVSRRELDTRYRASFAPLVSEGLRAILVSGVRVTAVDRDVPFCLSPRGVTGYLREGMGFDGLVITDDIAMATISGVTDGPNDADGAGSTERAAVLAIRSGCDLVMTSAPNIRAIARAIEAEATRDAEFERTLEKAVIRIVAVKISSGLVPTPLRAEALSRTRR